MTATQRRFVIVALAGAMACSGAAGIRAANAAETGAAKSATPKAAAVRAPNAARIPAQTDGEYFARVGDCVACHTARGG